MNNMENQPAPHSIFEQILDRMFDDLQSDKDFPMALIGRLQRLELRQLTQADAVRHAIERGLEGKNETD